MTRTRHIRRVLLGAATLAVAQLGAGLAPPAAHAALTGCRSDPQVYLTDGVNTYKVTLSATLPYDSNYGDIQHIYYVLHAPAGMRVTSVHYTSGLTNTESFTFYADQPAHGYSDTTTVYTYSAKQTVQVNLQVVLQANANGGSSGSATVTGYNGQALTTGTTL